LLPPPAFAFGDISRACLLNGARDLIYPQQTNSSFKEFAHADSVFRLALPRSTFVKAFQPSRLTFA
jgi:hypothetical protein